MEIPGQISAEIDTLEAARLSAGGFFPCDRLFAFENGRSAFDPSAPAFQPKTRFLMLMKNARLAELESRYDEAKQRLTIIAAGRVLAEEDVRTLAGRSILERCLETHCVGETRGPVRLLTAPDGFRFTDSIRSGFVSILNLASVRDLQSRLKRTIDPIRFRANIQVDGIDAWSEEQLVGKILNAGGLRLKVLKAIDRCPATHVDPATAARDLDIMSALKNSFGHVACGIYVSVMEGGEIGLGDSLQVER